MITYRANASGSMLAAHRGQSRVGYVNHSPSRRPGSKVPQWTWELHLLRPEGGHYVGRSHTERDAKASLEKSFRAWMDCAQLQEKKQ